MATGKRMSDTLLVSGIIFSLYYIFFKFLQECLLNMRRAMTCYTTGICW